MIRISKNKVNQVPLTLNERSKLGGSANFCFELHEKTNGGTRFVPLTVLVTSTDRMNLFALTEVQKANEDLPFGLVNFTPGQYSYFVWETLQDISSFTGGTLFFTATTDSIIESGRLLVNDSGATTYVYDQPKPTSATTNNEFTFR